jgi:hypothetical protein
MSNQPTVSKREIATAKALDQVNPFGGNTTQAVKKGTLEPVRGNPNRASELARKYDEDVSPAPHPTTTSPAVTPAIDDAQAKILALQAELEKLKQATTSPTPTPIEDTIELPPLADLGDIEPPVASSPISEFRTPEGLPSYRCEFSGRDIFVGFPCYKTTNPVTAFALLAMALDFGRDKIRFDMSIGDAMIYHSRNTIAQKFMDSGAKWLIMLDDDIIPCIGRPAWMRTWVASARNAPDLPLQRHVLHRLIGSSKSLVGAAYFGRQEGAPLIASDQSVAGRARQFDDYIHPVDWVGTGCILVHRSVFESIQKSNPELAPKFEGKPWNYFQPIDADHGEDVSFCIRAKKAGHQPHVDLGTPCFHVGYKTYP